MEANAGSFYLIVFFIWIHVIFKLSLYLWARWLLRVLDELAHEKKRKNLLNYTQVTAWHPTTTSTVTGSTVRGGGRVFYISFQTLFLSLLLGSLLLFLFLGSNEVLT